MGKNAARPPSEIACASGPVFTAEDRTFNDTFSEIMRAFQTNNRHTDAYEKGSGTLCFDEALIASGCCAQQDLSFNSAISACEKSADAGVDAYVSMHDVPTDADVSRSALDAGQPSVCGDLHPPDTNVIAQLDAEPCRALAGTQDQLVIGIYF